MTEVNTVRSNLYWIVFSSVPTQIICFIISILVARILVPEDFGILGIAMMIIGYANTFSNVGLNEAIVQKQINEESLINTIFSIDLVISLILAIGVFLSADSWANFFNVPESGDVMKLAVVVFVASTFQGVAEANLRRDMKFKVISIINSFKALSVSGVTLVLAVMGYEYWSLILGQIIPLTIFSFILCIYAKWKPWFAFEHNRMKDVYNFGIWSFVKSQVLFLINHIDIAIVGRVLGTHNLGIYDKSKNIAFMPLLVITMNINAVVFSSFSRDKNDKNKLIGVFEKAIVLVSIIVPPVYVGGIIIAEDFVAIFLGEKWLEMSIPFQVILLACIFKAYGGIAGSMAIAVGQYKRNTINLIIAAIFFMLTSVAFVKYGVPGIAFAYLIYTIFEFALFMSSAINIIGVTWFRFAVLVSSGIIGSTIMYLIINYVRQYYFSEQTLANLIIIIICGAIIYTLYMLVLSGNESKALIKQFINDVKK